MPTHHAARRAAVLLGTVLVLAGCTTTVSGIPAPAGPSSTPPASPPGVLLHQQPGTGAPHQFGGVPAYDACTVLPLDVVAAAGVPFDLDLSSPAELQSARLTEDAADDPNGRGALSDAGISQCQYPGQHDLLLTFTIHQAPFDVPESQASHERSLQKEGAKEATVGGFRMLSAGHTDPIRSQSTMIFGQGFYATLDLLPGHEPDTLRDELVRRAAERLHAPPTGPATYTYSGDFAHVRPPCEIFTSADFKQALGFGTDGRPVEGYALATSHTVPAADSGTTGHIEALEVTTSCKQENQAAANSGVGTTPAQAITIKLTNYLTAQMATEANDYDCAPGKGYRRPFGEPKPIPFSVGDGLSCLFNMGSVQSPLTFKSGRTTVQMTFFDPAGLGDNPTAIRVSSTAAQAVAAKLAAG